MSKYKAGFTQPGSTDKVGYIALSDGNFLHAILSHEICFDERKALKDLEKNARNVKNNPDKNSARELCAQVAAYSAIYDSDAIKAQIAQSKAAICGILPLQEQEGISAAVQKLKLRPAQIAFEMRG